MSSPLPCPERIISSSKPRLYINLARLTQSAKGRKSNKNERTLTVSKENDLALNLVLLVILVVPSSADRRSNVVVGSPALWFVRVPTQTPGGAVLPCARCLLYPLPFVIVCGVRCFSVRERAQEPSVRATDNPELSHAPGVHWSYKSR